MDNEILTIEQAAEFLQVPRSTLYKIARQGQVPCRKVGRHWRFSRSALIAWTGREDQITLSNQPDFSP